MRPLLGVVAVGAAVVLTSCTSSQAGTPTAAPSSGSSPVASRPRPLDVSGADACKLVTSRQLASVPIDSEPKPGSMQGNSVLAGSPGCTFLNEERQYGFLIVTSAKVGLAEFVGSTGPRPSRKDIEVKGYPAVSEEGNLSAPERGSGACFVTVDVADGQLLNVQFSQIAASQDRRLPIETLCARAAQVAEAAVTTLQGG